MKNFCVIVCSLLIFSGLQAQDDTAAVHRHLDECDIFPMDTISTVDKYTKIILFSDHTWEYLDLGRPVIDSAGMFEGWSTEIIHAFKEMDVKDLPEEIDLCLVDSLNSYCVPYKNKVYSGYKFRRRRPHRGVDLTLAKGDTIRAAFNGVVRYSRGGSVTGGYGNLVVIRHTNGLETYYGHLSSRKVAPGDIVKAGEVIGLGGSTGHSTGPHLHFETRYMGKAFDPERVFDFENGTLRDTILSVKKHYFSEYSHYGQTDQESKEAAGRIVYKVRSGDTLGKIAGKYGTTVSKICKLNGIKSTSTLRIGQRLIVR